MVFNLDHLENSTQNQFKPWKTRIYGLTPRNSIPSGKVWKKKTLHPSFCMDMKWNSRFRIMQSQFLDPLLLKFKEIGDANQHFHELKECQKNNRIQNVDFVK